MNKLLLLLITLLVIFQSFGQNKPAFKVAHINLGENKYTLLVKLNEKVVYSGNFDSVQQNPVGTHYLYTEQGELSKIIAYELSENSFEGIPDIIQTTYSLSNNEIRSIETATKCTECEFTPTGTWKYFNKKGNLIRQIDANSAKERASLKHPLYEYFWQFLE